MDCEQGVGKSIKRRRNPLPRITWSNEKGVPKAHKKWSAPLEDCPIEGGGRERKVQWVRSFHEKKKKFGEWKQYRKGEADHRKWGRARKKCIGKEKPRPTPHQAVFEKKFLREHWVSPRGGKHSTEEVGQW